MAAHQKRNAKTALMVSISFAFTIFGGAGAELQTNLLSVILFRFFLTFSLGPAFSQVGI